MRMVFCILVFAVYFFLFPMINQSIDIGEKTNPIHISSSDDFKQITADNDIIEKVFRSTEFDLRTCMTNAWSRIDNKAHTMEELVDIAVHAASVLKLEEVQIFEGQRDSKQVKLTGKYSGVWDAVVILHNGSIDGDDSRRKETFLSIDISGMDSDEYEGLQKRMVDVYKGYSTSPRISQVWIGTFPGKMDISKQREICEKIFLKLQGKLVEGIESEHLISMTGYSKYFSKEMEGPKGAFNFNAAIRYNSYEDKTTLWLGTPIITVEY